MSPKSNKPSTDAAETHRKVAKLWSDAAQGWSRWEPLLVGSLWPVTHAILRAVKLAPGMHVLDVGSGIGDPALAAASEVGPSGSVLGVDLSAVMLATSRDRAAALHLDNATFREGAIETAELPANHFDAVTGRFSIIFFPDVHAGLTRLFDALRPGGRIAVSTWAPPDKNRGFALPSRELRKLVELPPGDPDAPGAFRLSGDGALASALQAAGFVDVTVEDVHCYLFARDAASYWDMVLETSSMLRAQYERLDEPTRDALRNAVMQSVEEFRSGDVLRLSACARVGSGTKPRA